MRFHNPRIASVPRAFRARIQHGICAIYVPRAISRDLSESRAVRVRKMRDRCDWSPSATTVYVPSYDEYPCDCFEYEMSGHCCHSLDDDVFL